LDLDPFLVLRGLIWGEDAELPEIDDARGDEHEEREARDEDHEALGVRSVRS